MEHTRRSGRIAKEVAILLLGTDTSGKVFAEETRTVVLSRHGAGIVSRHRFAPDEVLTLRLAGSSKEAEVRLVGQIGGEPDRYVYGVAFVDPRLDFWQIEFPPADTFQINSRSLLLECGICHQRQEVQPRDIEVDVYCVNQSILHYCSRCGTATLWKQSELDIAPKKAPEPVPKSVERNVPASEEVQYLPALTTAVIGAAESIAAPVAAAPAAEARTRTSASAAESEKLDAPASTPATPGRRVNRRRHVRTRVSFSACVRQGTSSDDIVECENVSKGGLSFRSVKRYDEGSLIEVAAPYSPGTPAIFVSALIKHVQELPGGRFFRHGAEYAKRPST